jgi:hypothetical protein
VFCGFEAVYAYRSLRGDLLFILGVSLEHSSFDAERDSGLVRIDPVG